MAVAVFRLQINSTAVSPVQRGRMGCTSSECHSNSLQQPLRFPSRSNPEYRFVRYRNLPPLLSGTMPALTSLWTRPQRGGSLIPGIIPKKFIPPNIAAALLLKVCVVLFSFPRFIHCSLPFTDCLECVLILNFYTLPEEKYVGSKLILFLTYGEIPVMFNLDH